MILYNNFIMVSGDPNRPYASFIVLPVSPGRGVGDVLEWGGGQWYQDYSCH